MKHIEKKQETLPTFNHQDESVLEEKASSLTQGFGGNFFEGGYPHRWPYSKNMQAKQGERK